MPIANNVPLWVIGSISVFITMNADGSHVYFPEPLVVSPIVYLNSLVNDDIVTPVSLNVNAIILNDIDSEIDELGRDKDFESRMSLFVSSSEQLKSMLQIANFKSVPDIFSHANGHIGLYWNTKNNEDIYLISVSDKYIFYKELDDKNTSSKKINTKPEFAEVVSKINLKLG